MLDFDILNAGLSRLNLHESRHVMRYVLFTQGSGSAASFDPIIAQAALAKLDATERAALTSYCQGFLPKRKSLLAAS